MQTTKKRAERFHRGDWVTFRYGTKNLFAQIVEDRGPLGINRRHLYRIRVTRDIGEEDSFELPEEELEAASPPNKEAIAAYLKAGGLAAILQAHLCKQPELPKVWLTFTPRGGVTHTFVPERSFLGGAVIPFFALREGKIATAKKEEVVSFLMHFGLNRGEAESIVAAVGTAT